MKYLNNIMKLLPFIGLCLFGWIIYHTGTDTILAAFEHFDYRWILPVPIVLAGIVYAKALKWRLILCAYGIEYSLHECVRAWLVGFFASFITPAKIGDTIRATYLQRDRGVRLSKGLSTLFIDRLLDLLTLVILIVVSLILLWRIFAIDTLLLVSILSCMGIVVAAYIASNERLMRTFLAQPLKRLIPARLHEKARDIFTSFYGTMSEAKQQRHLIGKAALVNLVSWTLSVGLFYIVAHSLAIPLTVTQLFSIVPIIVLIEILPLSISGIGTREAGLFFFFEHMGLPTERVVSYSLTYLVVGYWLLATLGLILWLYKPITLKSHS